MNPSEVAGLLKTADNILIITHKKPDGDTVGSACALCHALRRKNKTAFLFPNSDMPPRLLEYAEEYFAPDGFEPGYVVCVDVAAVDMMAPGADFSCDLMIDHHPTNPCYAKYNCLCGEKSACGEIVLEIIEALNGKPDEYEATMLYIAVSTDTGCFQYNNTNSGTFAAVSRLLSCGARNVEVNTKFFRKVSLARLRLESMIFDGMKLYRDGKIAVVTVTRDMIEKCGANEDDLEDIAGLAGRLDSEIVGITIRENPDGSSKISLRSTKEVDSSAVCAYFGGGGHKMASGCTIEADPDKAAKLLLEVLDSLWTVSS